MQTSKRKLAQIKGLSEAKCEKIYEAGEKIAPISAWQSGKFLLEHRQANLFRLTTGCADFDKMLGGGIETKSMTEVWSHFHALARHHHVPAGPRSCTLTHAQARMKPQPRALMPWRPTCHCYTPTSGANLFCCSSSASTASARARSASLSQ